MRGIHCQVHAHAEPGAHYRGFSGEGALLGRLADPSVGADADLVSVLLAWDPVIDIGRLAAGADFSAERTVAALTHLAASGRVGYDLAEESFFHRELPFGPKLEAMHPRLAGARALVSSGSVVVGERRALVRSGDTEHRVTFGSPHDICTCPWWGKHRGTRGPCKARARGQDGGDLVSLDPELVRQAIERNDAARVRELLRHVTEPDRRACAKALRPLLAGPDFSQLARTAFLAASIGLAGGPAAAHIAADRCDSWQQPADPDFDAIAGVLADRRPPWLDDFVARKLRARWESGLCSWTLARRLVTLGAIDRPDVNEYTTKMPFALRLRRQGRRERHTQPEFVRPVDALIADPGLLDDEVWRLFTVADVAVQLDALWADALVTLSERGRLDRGRLLDSCLDAFARDFVPNRVGWYVTFHDRMAPSLEEMAARSGRYLNLFATGSRLGISLGQKACARLLEAGLVPAEDFLAASGPALLFPTKNVATAQLKLIGKVAAAQPPARPRALAAAAVAFGHQRVDVQEAALNLFARHGMPEGAERLAVCDLAASLAPALSRKAAELGLPGGPAAPHFEIPDPPQAGPSAGDRLPPPLDDAGELIELLTQLMEDASDALSVERAVAGAVRLCALPAAERARLAAPLLKQAEKRLHEDYDGPFSGREISSDIAGLALAWGTGWSPDIDGARRAWGSGSREAVLRTGAARTMAGILSRPADRADDLRRRRRPDPGQAA